mmetsp:Transcript_110426/g.319155  ORF Transcript_110426/g.319155 Transcript_110426/m.319155 type:complete len:247 (-) Transcript_110426:601-1341(-)
MEMRIAVKARHRPWVSSTATCLPDCRPNRGDSATSRSSSRGAATWRRSSCYRRPCRCRRRCPPRRGSLPRPMPSDRCPRGVHLPKRRSRQRPEAAHLFPGRRLLSLLQRQALTRSLQRSQCQQARRLPHPPPLTAPRRRRPPPRRWRQRRKRPPRPEAALSSSSAPRRRPRTAAIESWRPRTLCGAGRVLRVHGLALAALWCFASRQTPAAPCSSWPCSQLLPPPSGGRSASSLAQSAPLCGRSWT